MACRRRRSRVATAPPTAPMPPPINAFAAAPRPPPANPLMLPRARAEQSATHGALPRSYGSVQADRQALCRALRLWA